VIETLSTIAQYISRALTPFARALAGTDDHLIKYFQQLGWDLPTVPQALRDLQSSSDGFVSSLSKLEGLLRTSDPDAEVVVEQSATFVLDFGLFATSLKALPERLRSQLPADFVAATHIDKEILGRLFDDALSRHLEYESPEIFLFARLLGLVEVVPQPADPARFQPDYTSRSLRWDRLQPLVTNPAAVARDVYGWGTPELDGEKLLMALRDLSMVFLAPTFFDYSDRPLLRSIIPELPEDVLPERGLRSGFLQDTPLAVFLSLYPLPTRNANEPQGLLLTLSGLATLTQSFVITPSLSLTINSQIDLASGVALGVWPDRAPKLLGNISTAPGALVQGANAKLNVQYTPPDPNERLNLLSFAGVQLDVLRFSFEAGLRMKDASEVYVQADAPGLRLRLGGLGQDSFLAQLLPDDLSLELSPSVGWSINRGFFWDYGSGPSISIPIGKRIGPVQINSLDVAATSLEEGFQIALGVSVATEIGPFHVAVEGLGVGVNVDTRGGNLGPIDLDLSAIPPKGIGLLIDAPTVVGGGFLRFDTAKGEYSGVLELKIADKISVKGFGLLSTRLPGGGKGFALVIVIFVEGFTPIPLGLGFKLTGIGGLLAINRSFDENALRTGLKEQTLDSVMFPKDPIRNAPQILSNLNKVFPPAPGHHLFGPMVQLSWGTPTLITAELALVLEFGRRLRLLILAQIAAILPEPKNDLVRIQMDAVGVIDFDQGTVELDATLHDSRLLKKFVLTGDMALRLRWQSSPTFALAVGGLHPAFNPPPNFPKLERIAINLSSGDNPRLRCESYFAITSNSVQWGARAELYAAAAGFSVHGDIGYDVLIQFDPFFFIADFHAQLQLKRGSTNLFKVRLEGSLSGPRPLHLKGKATFEILWWDFSIRIDKTLVEGEKPPLPAPVDVFPLLQEALANPGNWVGQLPTGRPVATLRENSGATKDVLLHPLGSLTVKQTVVPLEFDIERFGQTIPAGARRFTIKVDLSGHALDIKRENDFFARAQFVKMTDDQKLSAPSFESMPAGITMSSDDFSFSSASSDLIEINTIEFETWILDDDTDTLRRSDAELPKQPTAPVTFYQLSAQLLLKQASFGAAANSDLRRTGTARYRTTTAGKYQITKEGWSLITTENLQPAIKSVSYSEATQELQEIQRKDPARAAGLTIARLSEIQSKVE
jgi:hypothetical protein